ncbi:hypothetical protein DKX38_026333 [Salix brachista]|uniref:Uncharacterized protein n=1 Tax=Salix brachista TaxID=2182728 RepID=A0A5N5JUY6_9ROSI|nr:hypothetical protein DKX38_026333 [Salix brachista]
MGKLGKKARKFAKKNLQSVLKRQRKVKTFFKKKASKRDEKAQVEDFDGEREEKYSGRNNEVEDFKDISLDAVFDEDDSDMDGDDSDSDGYSSEDTSCSYNGENRIENHLEEEGNSFITRKENEKAEQLQSQVRTSVCGMPSMLPAAAVDLLKEKHKEQVNNPNPNRAGPSTSNQAPQPEKKSYGCMVQLICDKETTSKDPVIDERNPKTSKKEQAVKGVINHVMANHSNAIETTLCSVNKVASLHSHTTEEETDSSVDSLMKATSHENNDTSSLAFTKVKKKNGGKKKGQGASR